MRPRSASSASSRSTAPSNSPSSKSYVARRIPYPVSAIALRVVVLVPEERKRDHRTPEVEALGRRVVPGVRDDDVGERQERRLRDELLAPHVLGELELGRLRPFRDDESVRRARQHVDEPLHQVDVRRAEAARARGRRDRRLRARCDRGALLRRPTAARTCRADATSGREACRARSRPRRGRGRG